MIERARYATAHMIRFRDVMTPDQLVLSGKPRDAASWKIGPCGPVGPDGYRLPSNIWCAVALYRNLAEASEAMEAKDDFMPFVSDTVESWHLLLQPFRHHGECNHLDRETPGEIFAVSTLETGGVVAVITTAEFRLGPELKRERLVTFRRNVDAVDEWIRQADGYVASQAFTPHTAGDDGCTVSVWRDDAAMLDAMYRAGVHKVHMENHKVASAFDRSSFTRFRVLAASGRWNGREPLAIA